MKFVHVPFHLFHIGNQDGGLGSGDTRGGSSLVHQTLVIINFPRQDAGFAQEIVSTNIVVEMTLDGDKCLVHFISLHCLSSRFVSEMQTFAIETFDRVTK